MANREEIIQMLAELDPAALEDVVTTAYRQRGRADAEPMPGPAEGPERFARWLAHRHMASDGALERVIYLPTGAPANEIRLLEVNRLLLSDEDDDVIEPLDFTPDIADLPFKVFVADVTADQWERIKKEPGAILPGGWKLGDNRIYSRS